MEFKYGVFLEQRKEKIIRPLSTSLLFLWFEGCRLFLYRKCKVVFVIGPSTFVYWSFQSLQRWYHRSDEATAGGAIRSLTFLRGIIFDTTKPLEQRQALLSNLRLGRIRILAWAVGLMALAWISIEEGAIALMVELKVLVELKAPSNEVNISKGVCGSPSNTIVRI